MKQCDDCELKDSGAIVCARYELRIAFQGLLKSLFKDKLKKKYCDDTCYSYLPKVN